jgi:hypothetical protein
VSEESRMSTKQFFRKIEEIYGWDLIEREREIFYDMALEYGGGVVLENWELFQSRFKGHPAWEFQEWIQDILVPDEGEAYEHI